MGTEAGSDLYKSSETGISTLPTRREYNLTRRPGAPSHTLVAQGVFIDDAEGTRRFVPSAAPTDLEVARLLGAVRRRIVRLVARHGIDLEDPSGEAQRTDERLFDCPMPHRVLPAAGVPSTCSPARSVAGGCV